MQLIDTRGLSCPQPVLLVKKAIDSNPSSSVKVLVDDMAAFENITAFAKSHGWSVANEKGLNHFEMILTKR